MQTRMSIPLEENVSVSECNEKLHDVTFHIFGTTRNSIDESGYSNRDI